MEANWKSLLLITLTQGNLSLERPEVSISGSGFCRLCEVLDPATCSLESLVPRGNPPTSSFMYQGGEKSKQPSAIRTVLSWALFGPASVGVEDTRDVPLQTAARGLPALQWWLFTRWTAAGLQMGKALDPKTSTLQRQHSICCLNLLRL